MYTVQELIEALEKCPKDYEIFLCVEESRAVELSSVAINPVAGTVDLIAE